MHAPGAPRGAGWRLQGMQPAVAIGISMPAQRGLMGRPLRSAAAAPLAARCSSSQRDSVLLPAAAAPQLAGGAGRRCAPQRHPHRCAAAPGDAGSGDAGVSSSGNGGSGEVSFTGSGAAARWRGSKAAGGDAGGSNSGSGRVPRWRTAQAQAPAEEAAASSSGVSSANGGPAPAPGGSGAGDSSAPAATPAAAGTSSTAQPGSAAASSSPPAAAPAPPRPPAAAAAAPSAAAAAGGAAAAAPELRSFDLRLPDSASAVTGMDDLDDVALQQQAQDWGYTRLGRPFPEGISMTALADTLDARHFQTDLFKALPRLAACAALIAAGCWWQAFMHAVCPLWQQVACWLAVGTGYFGLFSAASDCAHFAFWPQEPLLQDIIGATLMAPALIPYEGWRLQYFNHLIRPNMLGQDSPLWHPLTPASLSCLPRAARAAAALLHATPLRFAARALAGWAACWDGLDLRAHAPRARPWVALSWAVPALFAALAWPAMLAGGGLERLAGWWLAPWLVFLSWQGLFSVASRTAPHIPFVEEGYEYDHGQAVVNGCVTLELPRWLEWLLGAPNLPLPATLSISIPSYNLRAAQRELEAKLGPYLTAGRAFEPRLLINLFTRWVVYDPRQRGYATLDRVEEGAEGAAGRGAAAGASSGALQPAAA